MRPPKTFDEYTDLVHQAIYEVDELRACIEDDLEEMERYAPFIDQLDVQLRTLYDSMNRGDYMFPAGKDLPMMALVRSFGRHIPFAKLLVLINSVHRDGLAQ